MLKATNIGRDNLISLGTCIGKFTKSGKFNLTITALEVLGQFAKVRGFVCDERVWPNHVVHSTRSGSSRQVKCRSCTETTCSRHIWRASARTASSTRVW